MTFTPRIDVLTPSQRARWPELRAVPRRYVLYGGTALALRLAHRASVDFDLPSSRGETSMPSERKPAVA